MTRPEGAERTGSGWQRLEDAGVELTSVATDISGPAGRAMLDALIAGSETRPSSPTWRGPGSVSRSPR